MLRYFCVLAWAVLILYLSSGPQFGIPPRGLWQPDKIGHFGVYAILGYLLLWALQDVAWRSFLLAVALAAGYGLLMELLQQAYFYGRQFDAYDALANTLGSAAGAGFCRWRFNRASAQH
jgi:VanZ family protein